MEEIILIVTKRSISCFKIMLVLLKKDEVEF